MQEDVTTQPTGPREATLRDVWILLLKWGAALVVVTVPLAIWETLSENTARLRTILVLERTTTAVALPCAILLVLITTRDVRRPSLFTVKELWSPRALLAVLFGFALCATAIAAGLANDPGARLIAPRHWLSLLLNRSGFNLTWTQLILSTVGTGILTPVAEEWMFRGFIQPVLVRRWGPIAGIAITALGFTVLHRWNVITLLATGIFAVVLGLIAYRRQTLTYCILMHGAYNLVVLAPGIWRSLQYLKVL